MRQVGKRVLQGCDWVSTRRSCDFFEHVWHVGRQQRRQEPRDHSHSRRYQPFWGKQEEAYGKPRVLTLRHGHLTRRHQSWKHVLCSGAEARRKVAWVQLIGIKGGRGENGDAWALRAIGFILQESRSLNHRRRTRRRRKVKHQIIQPNSK